MGRLVFPPKLRSMILLVELIVMFYSSQCFTRPVSPSSSSHLVHKTIFRTTSGATPDFHFSDIELHVKNIDWTVPTDTVLTYLNKHLDGLVLEKNIEIKPATKKPRDVGKCHGGSAKIRFKDKVDAQIAKQRISNSIQSSNISDTRTAIGAIRIDWAVKLKDTHTFSFNHLLNENLVEKRLHRQRRAEKYARQRQNIALKTDNAIETMNDFVSAHLSHRQELDVAQLDWLNEKLPPAVDPCQGGKLKLNSERGRRKRSQVEAFLHVLVNAILDEKTLGKESNQRLVADLGSGAGNLSIPLAWFLKDYETSILAIDINDRALERLRTRAKEANIDIKTLTEDLAVLSENNDYACLDDCLAIVSLHACGAASDLSILTAVHRSIPFLVSPCCIGKVKSTRTSGQMISLSSVERSSAPNNIIYPRSRIVDSYAGQLDYSLIITAADYSAGNIHFISSSELVKYRRGQIAKNIVDMDRLKWAEEQGYYIRMVEIPRLGQYYPKKQLLLGARKGTSIAAKLAALKTIPQLL